MNNLYSCRRTAALLVLSFVTLLSSVFPSFSQPVGGWGKITDSGFSPITFPGFLGGFNVRGMIAFDIDGDGRKDAVVVNASPVNAITVLQNLSAPGVPDFEDAASPAAGNSPGSIAYGDLDGDGKPDLLVANLGDHNISIFRNNSTPGHLSFDTAVKVGNVTFLGSLLIQDFDHDGKPDIAFPAIPEDNTHGYNGFAIFRNTSSPGTFSFQPRVDFTTVAFPEAVSSGDLTGDSLPELIYCPDLSNKFSILVNTSTPGVLSFDTAVSWPIGNYPIGSAIGDFDGDGLPDIAVSVSHYNTLSLFRNTRTGTGLSFDQTELTVGDTLHPYPGGVSISDLNMDGKPDLFIRCNNSRGGALLQNETAAPGSFAFAPQRFISILPDTSIVQDPFGEGAADGLAIDDFDGDGRPDLLMTDYRPQFTIVYNTLNIRLNRIGAPLVAPSGASPVSDTIATYITIDTTVQTHNGTPYLQRHFDIEPASNPATSTATVTLYYNQQDFDNFNALAAHGDDLPTAASDTADKAHILIFQYHGTSATRRPGSYSGSSQLINPDDSKIVWNNSSSRWEITFDVTGFSGFFLGTSGTVLPLTLLSFDGHRQGADALLDWTATDEIDVSRFEVQRSPNGGSFTSIGVVPATADMHRYSYIDAATQNKAYFYRLKIVDLDGKYSYSRIVSIAGSNSLYGLNLFPNPAHGLVTIQHPAVTGGTAQIQLLDLSGRVLRTIKVAPGSAQITLNLDGLAAGIYQVQWSDGSHKVSCPLLVK
ncbi:T9SS type A sorting domain-containing protein [Flavitalea sp. BT771]|uniref:T9SS type A sorting domain-containing protein n=1 Tax=Flavitalea sp. BT771 TaxID=3063329 RepID=UPI0026E35EE5|nr:T9SS type A sorting domain-containing protein [Flavitalea sp. BT771]MDO6431738.1 T9SS type A sorting domain-containing protein [Flavitalea sp. BT771]MDV6220646.1 T9SS type A sorting domain-containing protein [Flavitalea sp. BT771]